MLQKFNRCQFIVNFMFASNSKLSAIGEFYAGDDINAKFATDLFLLGRK